MAKRCVSAVLASDRSDEGRTEVFKIVPASDQYRDDQHDQEDQYSAPTMMSEVFQKRLRKRSKERTHVCAVREATIDIALIAVITLFGAFTHAVAADRRAHTRDAGDTRDRTALSRTHE